jgi:glycosyltransferase involved in cell wall biosynthesis
MAHGRSDRPLVSIITACLNAERTLERAISSVREQTYPNIEYIVVDGGSRDGTVDILKKHMDAVDVLISEPDSGIYDALNKGILKANGELVGFVMADDRLLPHAVEEIAHAWRCDSNIDLISGYTEMLNRSGVCLAVAKPSYDRRPFAEIPLPSTFVAAECFRKFGLFDTSYKIGGDAEFFFRVVAGRGRINVIRKTLAQFSSGGLSSNGLLRSIREYFIIRQTYNGTTVAVWDFMRNLIRHYLRQNLSRFTRALAGDRVVDRLLLAFRRARG